MRRACSCRMANFPTFRLFGEWDKRCPLDQLNVPAAQIWLTKCNCMKERAVIWRSLQISPWSFFLKLIWKSFKAPPSCVHGWRVLDFRFHVSSVAARHSVIDYPTAATLLWIYCRRHRLWLNNNDPDKQLKSVFAAKSTTDVRLQWQRRLAGGLSTQVELSEGTQCIWPFSSCFCMQQLVCIHVQPTTDEPSRWL